MTTEHKPTISPERYLLAYHPAGGKADMSLEAAQETLRQTAERVHLVLEDHYSGLPEPRAAALPAFGWLTTVYEDGSDVLNDADEIVRRAAEQNPAKGRALRDEQFEYDYQMGTTPDE